MPSTYRLQFLLEARVRVEAREMDLAVGREEVEGRGGIDGVWGERWGGGGGRRRRRTG